MIIVVGDICMNGIVYCGFNFRYGNVFDLFL